MKKRIKALRKARGCRQTIIAIENGKYNPTLELAMKLARFLQTPVEELFRLED